MQEFSYLHCKIFPEYGSGTTLVFPNAAQISSEIGPQHLEPRLKCRPKSLLLSKTGILLGGNPRDRWAKSGFDSPWGIAV